MEPPQNRGGIIWQAPYTIPTFVSVNADIVDKYST